MKRPLLGALFTAALLAASTASATVTYPFTGVTMVNHVDRVLVVADLCADGVSIRATKYAERQATPQQWAQKPGVDVDVAINADFFDFPGWTMVFGRARGGGQDWPAADQNKETRSYWQFGPAVAALVEPSTTAPAAGVTEIVGGHNTLIRNGKSLGPGFDGDSVVTTAHRRTAIGVDAAHGHVYMFASDASLDGNQVVASVVQMAAEGGAPAIDFLTNQDGGGSSQMYVRGQGQVIDSGRQVNNHLGLFARGSGPSPMCPNHVPRGAFDGATCSKLTGWVQDPDVPTKSIDVHFSFDGAAGTAGAASFSMIAGVARPDLVKPVGSADHGFDVPTPFGIFDGKAHQIFAYAVDSKSNANVPVGQKALTCVANPPPSIRRHIASPAVLAAWRLSLFVDALPLSDAVINAFGPGTDLGAVPELVRADDKSPEVWLVDGPYRRHVVDAASAAAWRFDLSKVVTTPAAQVLALAQGPDVRGRPTLARAADGAVYVLDDPSALPPGAAIGPDGGVIVPGAGGGAGGGSSDGGDGAESGDAPGDGGGCTIGVLPPRSLGWATGVLGAALAFLLVARRRRRGLG
jgi:hypothetical protein